MSLFKKRKGLNIRQRRVGEDDDDEASDNGGPFSNITVPPKKEKKKAKDKAEKKQQQQQSVLSFEDELEADDGIIFQEKKSSLSYKLRKEMKKERKEKKREEKEKQKTQEEKERQKDKNMPSLSELDELGIRIVNGREAEAIAAQPGDSDEEEGSRHIFRPRSKSGQVQTLDPVKRIIQSGEIPDANMIHLIRKQRQQIRERGDVVPLDDTVRCDENKGRLIRDDDNDMSDDEGDRLNFTVSKEDSDRKMRKEAFDAAQADAGEGSDHDDEWEKQQLMKAGATAKLHLTEPLQDGEMNSHISTANAYAMTDNAWGTTDSVLPTPSALPRPTNYQAEGIIKRLRDSRQSLDEVFRRHQSEAVKVVDDLVLCEITISNCNAEQQPLLDSFQFYQDMRGYVTDLRDCLNEKMGELNGLEEQVSLIYRQKAHKVIQRRRQDVKDQNDEFSPFAGKKAAGDEYRIRRAAEREGRRTRRRRERERKGDTLHHDGTSTDDEEAESERQMLQTELDNCSAAARQLFEDVEDDFAQLKRIMGRFEQWRVKDRSSYSDAYVSYNLPKIFHVYIRLQMLLWNPMAKDADGVDIERMNWYNLLMLYGIDTESETPQKFREDPDRKLMSHIAENVVLDKLRELVSCWWDPLSHVQTVRLVNLVRHYAETYPTLGPQSKNLKELTHAIIAKIRDAINNDVFIPMFPKSIYENRTSGVSLFFQRQFWQAWKLLSSILMWHKVLSDSVIHDLAIRSLLNLYLLPALNLTAEINLSDALDKCRNVINALPRAWAKHEGGTHTFLGRLEGFLVSLAEKLDPSMSSSHIREICDLLKSIGAHNQVEKISNKYL